MDGRSCWNILDGIIKFTFKIIQRRFTLFKTLQMLYVVLIS